MQLLKPKKSTMMKHTIMKCNQVLLSILQQRTELVEANVVRAWPRSDLGVGQVCRDLLL